MHKLLDGFEHLLAVEIETNRGPIVIATAYLPPRRQIFPFPEFYRFSRLRKPGYFLGDLNARHWVLGHDARINQTGHNVARLLQEGDLTHMGPDFPTYIRDNCATSPDIVLGNRDASLNVHLKPGPLTTSDHLPIVATISTNPILIETAITRDQYHKADWEVMQNHLQALPVTTNLRHASLNEIEQEVDAWYTDVLTAK